MRNKLFLLVAACQLVAFLPAQRTIVVDAMNRPGTDFTDLPPAFQAANPGDTILVRWVNARYAPVTTSKGVTLMSLAQDSATVDGIFTVANLPAGQRFVIKNVGLVGIRVSDCIGQVRVDQGANTGTLEVINSHDVWLNGMFGIGMFRLRGSTVLMTRCGVVHNTHDVDNSTLILAETAVSGEIGQINISTCTLVRASRPAMTARDSTIILAGKVATLIGGVVDGRPFCSLRNEAPAIIGTNVTVIRSPRAHLGTLEGTVSVTVRQTAAQAAFGSSPGSVLNCSLASLPGDWAILFASLPGTVQPTWLGTLGLDLGSLLLLDIGATDPVYGYRNVQIPLGPEVPFGLPLVFQSVVLTEGRYQLSTPVFTLMQNAE